MEVEIYDQTEMGIDITGDVRQESDPEALALMESLGLLGQQEINTKKILDEDGEETDQSLTFRNHYQLVSAEQQLVIMQLFPKHDSVEKYKNGTIPLRMLKEIAFIKEHFNYIYVFYAPPAEIVDPIVIASQEKIESWGLATRISKSFLIGRWGDALKPWHELYKDAVASKCLEIENEMKSIIGKCKSQIMRLNEGETPRHEMLIEELPRAHYMPFRD